MNGTPAYWVPTEYQACLNSAYILCKLTSCNQLDIALFIKYGKIKSFHDKVKKERLIICIVYVLFAVTCN